LINRLKNKENQKLLVNFTNFGIFQVFNYLVPLITIPYIVRIIGAEKFGIVSIALAIVFYFRIIVEYGFSITGVQLIAQAEGSGKNKSEIYSTIICIQTGLVIVGFIVLLILVASIESFRNDYKVYLFSYGIVPANMLIALWFYIGIEKIKYLNYVNFFGRILYIIFIFIFIKEIDDYYLIPLINSSAYFISGFLSIYLIINRFNIHFRLPQFTTVKKYIVDGWPLFISNFGINLYRNSNVIILGFLVNKEIVGLYSAGEKIIKVIQMAFTPVTKTLFPYISRLRTTNMYKSKQSIKKILKYMALFSSVITVGILLFAKQITLVALGPQFTTSKIVIQIGSLVIFFGVLNYIIGIMFMANFGLKREFSKSVLIAGFSNLFICYLLSLKYGIIGASISFSGTEILLFLLLIFYIYRNRNKIDY